MLIARWTRAADLGSNGRSVWESYGRKVEPSSLYLAQKAEHVGRGTQDACADSEPQIITTVHTNGVDITAGIQISLQSEASPALAIGMSVTGNGIPTGAVISSVDIANTVFTLSDAISGTVLAGTALTLSSNIAAIQANACDGTTAGRTCAHNCETGFNRGAVTCVAGGGATDGTFAVRPCRLYSGPR